MPARANSGPAPKDPSKRARRNADPIPHTMLEFVPGTPPDLPQMTVDDPDLGSVVVDWHPQTVEWWEVWKRAAQSDLLTEVDWSYLLDTALLHHQFWSGESKTAAAELRLRVAKFGATPEDRARLRMFFADADEKEAKAGQAGASKPKPEGPYGGLRAVQNSGGA